jgi:Ca-activated chloride channel family protein
MSPMLLLRAANLALVLACGLGTPFAAAQHRPPPSSNANFRAVSNLVLVPVTVLDRKGATVNGLPSGLFSIFEDKLPQPIAAFSQQDAPVSIGVILDLSGSMKDSLGQAKSVLRVFFAAANSEDDAFLYSVSNLPRKFTSFTTNHETILGLVADAPAIGSTALIDAIYAGLNEIHSGTHARKALLVVSDGMDNHSRYSKAELMARAEESNAQIYGVSIYNPPVNKKPIELQEERRGLQLLEDLALRTGGLHVVIRNDKDVRQAAATIGQALRNQYLIGYVPHNPSPDGKWHSIRVKLNLPGAIVATRPGYRSEE